MNERNKARMRLLLIASCALGCTVASLSGTLAALAAGAPGGAYSHHFTA
jgi:hypothetical protein